MPAGKESSAAGQEFVIPAEVHTDDHRVQVRFDALTWFQRASDDQIAALAACEWGGDSAADEVAEASAAWCPDIQAIFDHKPWHKDYSGFECHVDEQAALAWLKAHRQSVYQMLENLDAGAPDEQAEAESVFLLIQEGGSSYELYVHAWGSREEAEQDRIDCARDGAYRTSPVFEVPAALARAPGFYEAMEAALSATNELDLVDVPDEEPEPEGKAPKSRHEGGGMGLGS